MDAITELKQSVLRLLRAGVISPEEAGEIFPDLLKAEDEE
jgi:predicted PP-loop superfamily ATPase